MQNTILLCIILSVDRSLLLQTERCYNDTG